MADLGFWQSLTVGLLITFALLGLFLLAAFRVPAHDPMRTWGYDPYDRAARDPEFLAELDDTTHAFDSAVGDGLDDGLDSDAECEAILRHLCGEPYKVSTGIHGGLTYGYGRLNDNGFWELPLPERYVRRSLHSMPG